MGGWHEGDEDEGNTAQAGETTSEVWDGIDESVRQHASDLWNDEDAELAADAVQSISEEAEIEYDDALNVLAACVHERDDVPEIRDILDERDSEDEDDTDEEDDDDDDGDDDEDQDDEDDE